MMFVEVFSEGLGGRDADRLTEIDGEGRINSIIGIERRTVDKQTRLEVEGRPSYPAGNCRRCVNMV